MIIVFTLKLRITCVFLEKLLVCSIHVVNRICQSKFIHFFQPFIFFL